MWIRLLLLVALTGISLVFVRGRRGARHEAIRRLLLVAFVGAAALSVLLPSVWQEAADLVGVGRGTDLLLYAMIVAFLGFVATSYLRFRDLQRQMTEMARRLALDEAPPARSLDGVSTLERAQDPGGIDERAAGLGPVPRVGGLTLPPATASGHLPAPAPVPAPAGLPAARRPLER